MDSIFTLKEFRNFSWNAQEKYKHFNDLYRQKLLDFHHEELVNKAYRQYLKRQPNPVSDLTKKVEAKTRAHKNSMKFMQDEITMYKHEMAMWRDISAKVNRANDYLFNSLINKIKGFGAYQNYHRFLGDSIKIHVIITGYGCTQWRHQVMVQVVTDMLPKELLEKDSPIIDNIGELANQKIF